MNTIRTRVATQKIDRAGLKQVAAGLLEQGLCFDTRVLKRRDEPALS